MVEGWVCICKYMHKIIDRKHTQDAFLMVELKTIFCILSFMPVACIV